VVDVLSEGTYRQRGNANGRRARARDNPYRGLAAPPLVFLLYLLSLIDRVNLGFAALQMNKDLGLTPYTYSLGVAALFFGYIPCEIPSNLILERIGARRWIGRIAITWGLVASAMALVSGKRSFLLVRFLLGVAEAGLFPGMLLYLTYGFRPLTVPASTPRWCWRSRPPGQSARRSPPAC
jgi:ACS family tartrate transporter-like MFS transporter